MNNDIVQDDIHVQKEPLPFFNREPVAIMAAVRATLALAIGYGFSMSPEQMALIIVFVEAVLGLVTRQQVTPFVASGTTPNVSDSEKTPQVSNSSSHAVSILSPSYQCVQWTCAARKRLNQRRIKKVDESRRS